MDEQLIQQEYYCSFEGYQQGSYYSKQLREAEAANRIANVPWDSRLQVHTFWDLGIGDAMAIWFMQRVGKSIALSIIMKPAARELAITPNTFHRSHTSMAFTTCRTMPVLGN